MIQRLLRRSNFKPVAVACAATLALVACGGGDDADDDNATTPITASGGSSTAGVECGYSYSELNTSASVNLTSTASWTCSSTSRVLSANGVPDHEVGTFPNPGNPNTISA